MNVVSKQMFDDGMRGIDCTELIHPWTTNCYKSAIQHIFEGVKGTGKFYFIIYTLQLLVKGKLKGDDVKQQILFLLQSTLSGATFVVLFVLTSCFFRKILGRFSYYVFPGLAGSLGALSIFLEHPRKRGFTITSFLYLMLEVLVNTSEELNYIKRTKESETLIFMLCSAALIYLLRIVKHQKSYLWFFLPPAFSKSRNENKKHNCPHRGSCWDDTIVFTAKYFAFGVLVQWLRSTVPKINKVLKTPSLLNPFNWKNLKLGLFTGLYVMTYKITSCILCRYRRKDSPIHAIPSGFLAGITYLIRPDLTVILIAVCNLFMISEQHFKDGGVLPDWPFSELAFVIAAGILFRSQMVIPKCTPKQFVNLIYSFSNGTSTEMNKRLNEFIEKGQLKKLVQV